MDNLHLHPIILFAAVAELADAHDSKSCEVSSCRFDPDQRHIYSSAEITLDTLECNFLSAIYDTKVIHRSLIDPFCEFVIMYIRSDTNCFQIEKPSNEGFSLFYIQSY